VTQRIQLMPGFVQQVQQPCPHCGGKGKSIKKRCHVCHGHKVTRVARDSVADASVTRGKAATQASSPSTAHGKVGGLAASAAAPTPQGHKEFMRSGSPAPCNHICASVIQRRKAAASGPAGRQGPTSCPTNGAGSWVVTAKGWENDHKLA
jgi:hypothetical protein